MAKTAPSRTLRRTILVGILVAVTSLLAYSAVLLPILASLLSPSLAVGQVATQDYRAPLALTYESKVQTAARQAAAVQAIEPVYTPPDTSIARQQIEQLRMTLAYITSVREDPFGTQAQKLEDLAAMEDIRLTQPTTRSILNLSDARWQIVHQEAIDVLQSVMQGAIRSDRVDAVRQDVPNRVRATIPEDQALIAAELAAGFVAPNSVYSASLTDAQKQAAFEAVEPVMVSYVAGETIVQQGQRLSEESLEALELLGLGAARRTWQEPASAALLTAAFMALMVMFFHYKRDMVHQLPSLALIAALFLIFLFAARIIIPGHTIIPYVFPLSAYALTVATLFGWEVALITSLPLAVLSAYGLPYSQDLTLFYLLGSFFGVFALGQARRMMSFARSVIAISLSGLVVVLIFRLPLPGTDWIGLASLVGAAAFNGLASASLTIVMQYFLSQLLGMTTPMQLVEMTRPDNPLLRMILQNAPGTYQHSLLVANLAEQAAERIGADTLLTRVGALYHDVGKAANPLYFIENQMPGLVNPHDELDPVTSANYIIRHVTDGLDLARRHRLPRRIHAFIAEHHGRTQTRYQYVKAVKAAGSESLVDPEIFRYPGPIPQSRETALLMLADGSEAQVRAEKPKTEGEMRDLIKNVIDTRIQGGELDDAELTLQDLKEIADSFTTSLRGLYHPRVIYPKLETTAGAPDQGKPTLRSDSITAAEANPSVPEGRS